MSLSELQRRNFLVKFCLENPNKTKSETVEHFKLLALQSLTFLYRSLHFSGNVFKKSLEFYKNLTLIIKGLHFSENVFKKPQNLSKHLTFLNFVLNVLKKPRIFWKASHMVLQFMALLALLTLFLYGMTLFFSRLCVFFLWIKILLYSLFTFYICKN
jgi:hypothetical protein